MPKAQKPVIAIMYDFDKTLCTKDMQEYTFIPSLGLKAQDFWAETERMAREDNMDAMLAYMYLMLRKSHDRKIPVTRDAFKRLGAGIEYYPGVESWFGRLNDYGAAKGIRMEHYVISSGLQEIIEGSSIYPQFQKTYACEFLYDENGVAVWPKNVMNYTTKTQFLFRINKGVLDVFDNVRVNEYVPEDERPIPFRNMIYIGDGLTDVPCMKLVKSNGGQSIAVFKKRKKETAKQLLGEGRVDFIVEADYREGSELDGIVKLILDKMTVADQLVTMHKKHEQSL